MSIERTHTAAVTPGVEPQGFGQTVVMPDPNAANGPNLQSTVLAPQPGTQTGSSTGTGSMRAQNLPLPELSANTRYQTVEKLGEGGMGEVVLSRDPTIGRKVAVKRMKRQPGDNTVSADRFMAEVQMTGRLEHPGIVPIYDAGQDVEGMPYFVMKYVDGEPLNQIIAKLRAGEPSYVQRFSYEHRTQLFMQLVRAVQYAHHQGVLHLDIKPANVIVGPFGEVVLVDWGIARHKGAAPDAAPLDPKKPAITFTGTPDYMAPEQAMGKLSAFGPHTDTYCLSVLFYELITLHYYLPPKQTLEGRITSILIDEPLTGLQMHHRFGAPPELTNYIHYGLNKDETKRFLTADEMVDKLQAVMDGIIPVVCPCTGIKRAANTYGGFMNAHPILAVVGVSLLSLFALFGVFELLRLLAFRST